jgi:glutaredoxin 3
MKSKVEIYTKSMCPYCARAKSLLAQKGVNFAEYDASGGTTRTEMLARAAGRTSVPQIFINDHHVGGCDDLFALEEAKALDALLSGAAPA